MIIESFAIHEDQIKPIARQNSTRATDVLSICVSEF